MNSPAGHHWKLLPIPFRMLWPGALPAKLEGGATDDGGGVPTGRHGEAFTVEVGSTLALGATVVDGPVLAGGRDDVEDVLGGAAGGAEDKRAFWLSQNL